MPEIKFDSHFLKIDNNVYEGDIVRFLNSGVPDEKTGKWEFLVGVRPQGVERIVIQKKFSIGPMLFKVVSALYGTNSDNWIGKEMEVKKISVTNMSTGLPVAAVGLVAVGGLEAKDVEEFLNK